MAVLLLSLVRGLSATEAGDTYMALEFGLFTHWGINTYSGTSGWDGDPADYPSSIVAPTDFDAYQLAEAAANAGMKYIIFTAKHHYGWCSWDSQYTDYDIATSSTPWLDPVREMADAAAAFGLKLVIYYSILDRTHYHDLDTGRNDSQQYLVFARRQLSELLIQYGPIEGVWFDAASWTTVDTQWALRDHVKRLQPNATVIFNSGPIALNARSDVITREGLEPDPDNVDPFEMTLNLYEGVGVGWWAITDSDGPSEEYTPAGIVALRQSVNERNANLAANVPIGPNGRVSDEGLAFLSEIAHVQSALADGDVNLDGQLNAADIWLATRILLGQYQPSALEEDHMDVAPLVNGVSAPDGELNVGDLVVLQRKVLDGGGF